MITKIFSVYDQKAKIYSTPFFLPQEGMATRTFADCVNKEGHAFNMHPSDYNLAELAHFDDETGVIHPHEVAIQYGSGVEFVNPPEPTG